MKINRTLIAPAVLLLLIAIAGGVAWMGSAPPAYAAGLWRTVMIPISGTVNGAPETVVFSGQAKISSRIAPDPVFNVPSLVLNVDLTGLSAVGSSTKSQYAVSSLEVIQRRASSASQMVAITFPFASGDSLPLIGVVSFALDFDLTNGAIIAGTGNISSPSY